MLGAVRLLILSLLIALPAFAAKVKTRTYYDDESEAYYTRGDVVLQVPMTDLARVAGALDAYRKWSLKGINGSKKDDRDFITQLRDVRHGGGGSKGLGVFDVHFDVDLVWPFGSKGNIVRFEITRLVQNPGGGIKSMHLGLYSKNIILKTFNLRLDADGDAKTSRVKFRSQVRFAGAIDTFFSLARYKKNIEWRIVKVIKNLKAHLEAGG